MAVAKVVKSVVKKETRGRKRKRGRGIGTKAEKEEAKIPIKMTRGTARGMGAAIKGGSYLEC